MSYGFSACYYCNEIITRFRVLKSFRGFKTLASRVTFVVLGSPRHQKNSLHLYQEIPLSCKNVIFQATLSGKILQVFFEPRSGTRSGYEKKSEFIGRILFLTYIGGKKSLSTSPPLRLHDPPMPTSTYLLHFPTAPFGCVPHTLEERRLIPLLQNPLHCSLQSHPLLIEGNFYQLTLHNSETGSIFTPIIRNLTLEVRRSCLNESIFLLSC